MILLLSRGAMEGRGGGIVRALLVVRVNKLSIVVLLDDGVMNQGIKLSIIVLE